MTRGTVRDATCPECGNDFQTDQPHRRKCYGCNPARVRDVTTLPFVGSDGIPSRADHEFVPGRIEKTTVKKLQELGQLDTPDGALLERMARDLDSANVVGAARTSMSKQLSVALAEIEAKIPAKKDVVDTWADRARRMRERAMEA